jgi:hypothetical protein
MTQEQAFSAARSLLESALPRSLESNYTLTAPLNLLRCQATAYAPSVCDIPESVIVPALRTIQGIPVLGRDSVAVVEVRNGHPVGALIRWRRSISTPHQKVLSITSSSLETAVANALSLDLTSSDLPTVTVTSSPSVVYVDDGTRLEPTYRISGTIDLGTHVETFEIFSPGDPDSNLTGAADCEISDVQSAMKVETYAYSGDGYAWMKNARMVNLAFQAISHLDVRRTCAIEDAYLKKKKAEYIDAAEFAIVESHGAPGSVLTENGVLTALRGVGGYGHLVGGALRLLLLHSCLVVESPRENCEAWQEPWFGLFAGLHTVLGFRTDIEYTDGVSAAFARSLKPDADLIRNWMLEATGHYSRTNPALGKASAVTSCDHQRESLANILSESTPVPECLVIYWLE